MFPFILILRSNHRRCSVKKAVLENFAILKFPKTTVLESLFNIMKIICERLVQNSLPIPPENIRKPKENINTNS